jgi:hypothetical protein
MKFAVINDCHTSIPGIILLLSNATAPAPGAADEDGFSKIGTICPFPVFHSSVFPLSTDCTAEPYSVFHEISGEKSKNQKLFQNISEHLQLEQRNARECSV